MQQFQLEPLFHIIGIGQASGLIYKNNSLYIISDNGSRLLEFDIENQTQSNTFLFENAVSVNIPKKEKADFESIANHGDDFYVFGSGSTANRNIMVHYNSKTKATKTVDTTALYSKMQYLSAIDALNFNIEGAIFTGEIWYIFQRGNGLGGKNGIFTIHGKSFEDTEITYHDYVLPNIKGCPYGFTDAVLVENQLYFLAAAEDSKSIYDDGDVLGCIVGSINITTQLIEFTLPISDKRKFEGITLYKKSENQIEFLLCEDDDSDILESDIFKLTLNTK